MTHPYGGFLKLCAFCFVYLTWSLVAFYIDGISGKVFIAGCLLLLIAGGWWMTRVVKSRDTNSPSCSFNCSD